MAYPSELWIRAKAYYENGLPLVQISEKTGISKTQIGMRSQNWQKANKTGNLVKREVAVIEQVASIIQDRASKQDKEGDIAMEVHDELVLERAKHIRVLNNITHKSLEYLQKKLTSSTDIPDIRLAIDAISKAKGVLLGKDPGTIINNTNAQQMNMDQIAEEDEVIMKRWEESILRRHGIVTVTPLKPL